MDEAGLKEREASISGLAAIYVKSTGIVDYTRVSQAMVNAYTGLGGEYLLNESVIGLQEDDVSVAVSTEGNLYQCSYLIACAGLMADRLAQMQSLQINFRILPFRGEYYQLSNTNKDIISHLIYPVPDPKYPFLGVHLTRMIDGSVTVGPNAVLGWKREGYRKFNFSFRDSLNMLLFPGFWQIMLKNFKFGLNELKKSLSKSVYLKEVQKYCPQLGLKDLCPYPTGIRAQAVLADGSLVHDFLFVESDRSLHVCNAPSPAATSAIPIGAHICDRIANKEKEST